MRITKQVLDELYACGEGMERALEFAASQGREWLTLSELSAQYGVGSYRELYDLMWLGDKLVLYGKLSQFEHLTARKFFNDGLFQLVGKYVYGGGCEDLSSDDIFARIRSMVALGFNCNHLPITPHQIVWAFATPICAEVVFTYWAEVSCLLSNHAMAVEYEALVRATLIVLDTCQREYIDELNANFFVDTNALDYEGRDVQ